MPGSLFKTEVLSQQGPLLLLIGGVNTKVRHWTPYIDLLSGSYTVVCVSLSEELEDIDLDKPDSAFIDEVINITKQFNAQSLNIISFSMGSRVALKLLEYNAQTIINILCIAPDGIKTHPVFYFATKTALGRAMFKYIILHMGILYAFCRAANTLHLIDPILLSLSNKLRADKASSMQLYFYWITYSRLTPNWKMVNTQLKNIGINLTILFGSKDVFISPGLSKEAQKLCPGAHVHLLDVGHYLKDEAYVNRAKQIFLIG